MYKNQRYIFLLFAIILITKTYAQGLINIQHYSNENGLSESSIQGITQDEDGYIWLATRNGLEMFDGYEFTNYKSYPTNMTNRFYNRLVKLQKGGKSYIWCKTYDGGILLFDCKQRQFEDLFTYHPHIKRCTKVQQMISLQNNVLWIIGKNGELWRCNEENYNKENGLTYFPPNSTLQHGNTIYNILLDADGNEWIFTNKGFFSVGKKRWVGNKQFQLFADVNKQLFMATSAGELFTLGPNKTLRRIVLPQNQKLLALIPLKKNLLGIATQRSLFVYNPQTRGMQHIAFADKEEEMNPHTFYQTQNGNLWFFNHNKEIICCNLNTNSVKRYPYTIDNKAQNHAIMHEDEYGQLWALPSNGEFSYFNASKQKFEVAYTYQNGEKILYNSSYYQTKFSKPFIDSHRNIWLSCNNGFNIIVFSNNSYHYNPSTHNSEIRSIFIDSNKNHWYGDKKGYVEVYDDKQNYIGNLSKSGQLIKDKNTLFGANVYCIHEDKAHRIWLGSREKGLYVAEPIGPDRYKLYQYTEQPGDSWSLSSNSIYSIIEDNHGRTWIGTYGGGLNLVEGTFPNLRFINLKNKITHYPTDLKSLRIRNLLCTSNGTMMVGTTNGLFTFSSDFEAPEKIKFFHNHAESATTKGLYNNDVLQIFESKSKEIYTITFSGGISKIVSKNLLSEHLTFKHFDKRNKLPSDIAYAMVEANDGNFWISFEMGLCKFNPQTYEVEDYTSISRNLHQLNSESIPVLDHQQNLYIGTKQGVLHFNLKELHKSSFVPPIVFTKATIREDEYTATNIPIIDNKLVMQKDERNVTISFAALDFTNQRNLQYSYRLKELSDKWVDINQNHSASFINLPSGDFSFEVKSTNGDGDWTGNTTRLSIHICPTFWETGWAWTLYILAFILVILIVAGILAYIFNLRRKVDFEQQLTQLKLRFFTNISHDLRTPLTLITAPVEEVMEKEKLSQKGFENMVIAKRNIDRMLTLINQIIDFRKIENNKMKLYIEQTDVIALLKRTFDNFTCFAEQREIDFRFISPITQLNIYTDVDKLEKIIFNLLSNAFKYTPNGKSIRLTIEPEETNVTFIVQDEGQGFDIKNIDLLFERFETLGKQSKHNSSGIGLSLVNELTQLIHGHIQVESSLGEGSKFSISVPRSYQAFAKDTNMELILNDGKEPDKQESTTPIEENGDKELALIVEDNEELRHLTSSILQEQYTVIEAVDGIDGLEKIRTSLPDLIISDIMMPRMDGIELLANTRKDHNISHIPFILLSAKSTLEDRISGLEYGADYYITKPFSGSYLKACIASLLKQRKLLRNYYTNIAEDEQQGKGNEVHATKEAVSNTKTTSPSITQYDEAFIKKLIEYVEQQLINPDFKIEDLADTMNLSRTVFYRKIKSILGVSPKDFVRDLRVKKAVQLFNTGEYNISEIAYMSGFSSPQYFSRVFKEVMNCTPTEYKSNIDAQ